MHSEDRLRQPRADTGHRLQGLEDGALVLTAEAVKRQGVLADDQRRREARSLADAKVGERVRRTDDGEAHTADLDDRGVRADGTHRARQARDHRALIAAAASRA